MAFLVKVGGELYLPCEECLAGAMHYRWTDVEPVTINVNGDKLLKPALERLFRKLGDNLAEFNECTRVNLLYQNPGDEIEIKLDPCPPTLDTVLKLPYDFFVKAEGTENNYLTPPRSNKRFTRDSRRALLFDGQRVDRQRITDVFGGVEELALTYIGSVGAELKFGDGFDQVSLLGEHEDEKFKQNLLSELEERVRGVNKLVSGELYDIFDLLPLRIMAVVCNYRFEDLQPTPYSDLIGALKEDEFRCGCYYGYTVDFEGDVERAIAALKDAGFLIESEEGYQFRIPETIVIPKEQLSLPI